MARRRFRPIAEGREIRLSPLAFRLAGRPKRNRNRNRIPPPAPLSRLFTRPRAHPPARPN
ncbi:hypothetical protein Afil01_61160 [Actinorhabdospora filicis]|uniref:Uncharacterized protein n=1 Tax=Actinorhabdospora filicis TaxID=1785913 RepID=A0A9W6SST0_9ACTN|nr:hypothetical protein Afil01_61160 [Actinorhabdospora filicis]